MIFKADWEQTQHRLSKDRMTDRVAQLCPSQGIRSATDLSGGCANLNTKVQLLGGEVFILRVYLRDKYAAGREKKLGELLANRLPVPQVEQIVDGAGYRYAKVSYLPGTTLRDVLLSEAAYDICAVMHDVARVLAIVSSFSFDQSGFFDEDLRVVTPINQQSQMDYMHNSLQHSRVVAALSPAVISRLGSCLSRCGCYLPDGQEKHLVHGDFDPSNILVERSGNGWRISGILDWEFAFSGSVLCDVATMLRYAHRMPTAYQTAFLSGLQASGIVLPNHWQISVHMLNLLSLLDCLIRTDSDQRIRQCDISALIDGILMSLEGE